MKFKYMNKIESKKIMEEWKLKEEIIEFQTESSFYEGLKNDLTLHFKKYKGSSYNSYDFDLYMGLFLYDLLNGIDGFNQRISSNDDFWNYLSIRVIPKIVAERWGYDNDIRFYKQPNRTYLKSLYWYIYLTWQGSMEATFTTIGSLTTDTILQLTERPGKGFDAELTRLIINQYSIYAKSNSDHGRVFRSLMKLNMAYLNTIEPKFFSGGYEAYVNNLLEISIGRGNR